MNDGALIDRMIRVNDLWGGEPKKGVDGDKDDANGITMNGTSPLKVMICANEERRSNISLPKRGERLVIGLMD